MNAFQEAPKAREQALGVLDVEAVRRDFPILSREVNGYPLAYLDSAASSQKPQQVIDAASAYYARHHSNVHRGAHSLAAEATDAYEAARETVAAFLGAAARELVFTRNATEAINLVAATWGRANLRAGDEVVLSVAEHHANLLPWQRLRDEVGAVLRYVPLDAGQRLDMTAARALIGPKTKLVATFHMSNVLGAINPVATLAELAHSVGAVLLVDGAQGAPHLPVDVMDMGADFYAFSGHKMLGPTGIGGLYGRYDLLAEMPPFLLGGEMIERVTLEGATYAAPPARFEAGTPAIAEAVGLAAAVDYLRAVGLQAVHEHSVALTERTLQGLERLPGVTTFGPRGADRGGIVAFTVQGIHPHDLATALDQLGVAVRAGHHCAQPLGKALGATATARASYYLYNTAEEVDRLVAGVASAIELFGLEPAAEATGGHDPAQGEDPA